MKLFIGIDVSSKDLQVAITDSKNYQKPLLNQSFSNDLIGASKVKKKILQLAKQTSYDKVIIGMEATSIYSFHPAYFFANDEDLQKLNLGPFKEKSLSEPFCFFSRLFIDLRRLLN